MLYLRTAMIYLSYLMMRARKKSEPALETETEEGFDDLGLESEDDLAGISKKTLRQAVVFSTDWGLPKS
jgi:hypothetical protein